MAEVTVPSQKEFYNPTLQALHNLGGSGTNKEIKAEAVKIMNLTDAQLKVLVSPGTGERKTLVANHLSWARSHMKRYGLLENPRRAFCALTAKGRNIKSMDPDDVQRTAMQMAKEKGANKEKARKQSGSASQPEAVDEAPILSGEVFAAEDIIASLLRWQDELSSLLHGMSPTAFERLFLRILDASGIKEVDVTGRSGAGMIEGIYTLGDGFLSLRVSFRCVRGNRLISMNEVDDFRRAVMVGRANKGLLVTTGSFTQEAVREASLSSAPEIELIDGEQLIDKLKELSLGVKTERVVVERVMIDADWFQNI